MRIPENCFCGSAAELAQDDDDGQMYVECGSWRSRGFACWRGPSFGVRLGEDAPVDAWNLIVFDQRERDPSK